MFGAALLGARPLQRWHQLSWKQKVISIGDLLYTEKPLFLVSPEPSAPQGPQSSRRHLSFSSPPPRPPPRGGESWRLFHTSTGRAERKPPGQLKPTADTKNRRRVGLFFPRGPAALPKPPAPPPFPPFSSAAAGGAAADAAPRCGPAWWRRPPPRRLTEEKAEVAPGGVGGPAAGE